MDLFEKWVEHDYNPLIIFNKDAKVSFINKEAQFLLGFVSAKEIFKLASSYASQNYGFKTTIIDLNFGKYSFFAITVGYSNDTNIGIRFYKKPNKTFNFSEEDKTKVNIYAIIDLCISSFLTASKTRHKKILDPTFPDIYIKVEPFLKLLTKIYNVFQKSDTIITKLNLKTGEHIVYKTKKYPIFILQISGDKTTKVDDYLLKDIATKTQAIINIDKNSISLELPLIDSIN